MKVLLNCEESQTVCKAFRERERGHEAFSCDLLSCSGGHPEWHLQQDGLMIAKSHEWDLQIAFPPCTHLAVSGAKHFELKRNDGRQKAAIEFFLEIWLVSNAVENPVGIMNGGGYIKKWFPDLYEYAVCIGFPFKPSQIVQPYWFGDKHTKTTCLWLKDLPLLVKTNDVGPGPRDTTKSGRTLPTWYNLPPGEDRNKIRSKTFPGIAKAMAEQWG